MKEILIIEDDMAISHMLAAMLRSLGYAVRRAAHGQEGLSMLSEYLPALILCDVMMPILDGRAVCRHIQATPRYQSIPLVMMSAGVVDLSACQYTAFLQKPFDLSDLEELVTTLIGPD
jgi:two-component system, OmpR family, alkaline phosphatase synthesis response regulator PhoP